jgi:glycerol-3-phosphate acyltransferase PlsY
MMLADWLPALLAIVGYLVGSIPSGVVISRWLGAIDPRTAGSHNIGFTNVLRVSGKKAGVLTLLADLGKGWLVAWAAGRLIDVEVPALVVAGMPILGHLYPVFLGFRGGKGVATAFGVFLGLAPQVGGMAIGIWLCTAAIWRYSSGAAIAAFTLLPMLAAALGPSRAFTGFSMIVSAVILHRHRTNIQRLLKGTEPRIGQRSSPEGQTGYVG